MPALPRQRVYAMLMIVLLLWAGNSIVGRAVRADIPPFSLAFFRWAGAFAILLPFAWRGIAADWPVIRSHWVGSSRVDLQACKLEYSIVSPK